MKNVLIVCNLFGNNRQGEDLARVLRGEGCRVRLVSYSDKSDLSVENIGVGYIKPHGVFSKFHVLTNLLRIFFCGLTSHRDVVVCIGRPLLVDSAILAFLARADLIYYSLEYCHYTEVQKWVVRHCVRRYIDVEEARKKRTFEDLNFSVPSRIMYNLPSYSPQLCKKGAMRKFLVEHKGVRGDEKIVLYAGSYQGYACLEKIYAASAKFDEDVLLVFMVARGLPESCSRDTAHCKIVPAQSGQTFFDWISDADCSLLPYESTIDFNVQHCSPQKLFDCYRVGLPYLASARPLIQKVNSDFSQAGIFCDFTNVDSIVSGVHQAVHLKTHDTVAAMQKLYKEKYNYSRYAKWLSEFILGENEDASI